MNNIEHESKWLVTNPVLDESTEYETEEAAIEAAKEEAVEHHTEVKVYMLSCVVIPKYKADVIRV